MPGGPKELMNYLEKLGIDSETVEHPEVFTVEAMMTHLNMKNLNGVVVKNLFMKDKKKKGLWLITVPHDREVNLTDLGKKVNAPGGLRFADESILLEKLGVAQGCVTPLALFNDVNHDVKFVLDDDILEGGHNKVYSHPMRNSATTGITAEDFLKFLKATGHEPIRVVF